MKESEKKLFVYFFSQLGLKKIPYYKMDSIYFKNFSGIRIEDIAKYSGVSLKEIENLMLGPSIPFSDNEVVYFIHRLKEKASKEVLDIIRKFKKGEQVEEKNLEEWVRIICDCNRIPYSSELTKKTIQNLEEYIEKKQPPYRPSLWGRPSLEILEDAVILARKQLGGPEKLKRKSRDFKEMLAIVDGLPQPSKRVEIYLQKLAEELSIPTEEKENICKECIQEYRLLLQRDKKITSKNPAVLAGAMLKRQIEKRNYFGLTEENFQKYSDTRIAELLNTTNVTVRNMKKYVTKLLEEWSIN